MFRRTKLIFKYEIEVQEDPIDVQKDYINV